MDLKSLTICSVAIDVAEEMAANGGEHGDEEEERHHEFQESWNDAKHHSSSTRIHM